MNRNQQQQQGGELFTALAKGQTFLFVSFFLISNESSQNFTETRMKGKDAQSGTKLEKNVVAARMALVRQSLQYTEVT